MNFLWGLREREGEEGRGLTKRSFLVMAVGVFLFFVVFVSGGRNPKWPSLGLGEPNEHILFEAHFPILHRGSCD